MSKVVEIAGKRYEATACHGCSGSGESIDVTNMDKVNAGPVSGRCGNCRGEGETYRLIPTPEHAAYEARLINSLRTTLAESSNPNSDLPDWMM